MKTEDEKMIRLASILMEVVAGNISTGKARELLREEGFPSAVWQKVTAPIQWDDQIEADAKSGALDRAFSELSEEDENPAGES